MSRPQMPRRPSSKSLLIPAMIGLGELGRSNSFTLKSPPATSLRRSDDLHSSCPNFGVDIQGCKRVDTSLNMLPNMPSFSLSDAAAPAGDFLSEMGSNLLASDDVKQEGVNLLKHALLDFPAHLARSAVAVKAAEVAGRLFVLKEGMGHHVMPDELAFQVGFLAVSCHALWNTVMPKIKAAQASKYLTPADRKAYQSLFKPAGLSWEQYREVSLNSMEWVTLEPGQEMINIKEDNSAFWLYQGEVSLESEDFGISHITSGMFGEDSMAETLGLKSKIDEASKTAAVAGPQGATVLKMNTGKLQKMLTSDKRLGSSMTRMLFNSMEEKLATRHSMANQAA